MNDQITAEWCRERDACYDDERLAALFDRPMTLREVMTREDGPWENVSPRHRVWVACHALPAREARLLACQWAERALIRERDAGREPHADCWRAIEVSRRYADGLATAKELAAARAAAWAWATLSDAASRAAAFATAWAWATALAAAAAADVVRAERLAQVADVLAVLDEMGGRR